MMRDVQAGECTLAELRDEKEESLAAKYGSSRDTVRKACKAVLSKIVGANSDN
jgi:hypothetical protein